MVPFFIRFNAIRIHLCIAESAKQTTNPCNNRCDCRRRGDRSVSIAWDNRSYMRWQQIEAGAIDSDGEKVRTWCWSILRVAQQFIFFSFFFIQSFGSFDHRRNSISRCYSIEMNKFVKCLIFVKHCERYMQVALKHFRPRFPVYSKVNCCRRQLVQTLGTSAVWLCSQIRWSFNSKLFENYY